MLHTHCLLLVCYIPIMFVTGLLHTHYVWYWSVTYPLFVTGCYIPIMFVTGMLHTHPVCYWYVTYPLCLLLVCYIPIMFVTGV